MLLAEVCQGWAVNTGISQAPNHLQKLVCYPVAVIWAVGGLAVVLYQGRRPEMMHGLLPECFPGILSVVPAIPVPDEFNDIMDADPSVGG